MAESAEHVWAVSAAGGSAQAEFERRRERNRARIRRQWPFALGCGVVLSVLVGAVVQALVQEPALTALVVAVLALVQLTGFLQSSTVRSWGVGAEGERKTAAVLGPLREEGFVILHDRKVTGHGGNLDHLVIGPTGLWAVETKHLRGKVVIRGDTLRIGGHRRDKIIDQVKQEATIIQVVLGDSLAARAPRHSGDLSAPRRAAILQQVRPWRAAGVWASARQDAAVRRSGAVAVPS